MLPCIELSRTRPRVRLPILYEDRACLVIDKPPGWLLAPAHWDRTARNLTAALMDSIRAGDFWARSRRIKFLRFVHRLDAETTGLVLMVKHRRLIEPYSRLFEQRAVEKTYLAVVDKPPAGDQWTCLEKIAPVPGEPGRMRLDPRRGKAAETHFRVLARHPHAALIEARPLTGRTHQIRLHLAAAGCPVVGDLLYGGRPPTPAARDAFPLALRAVRLSWVQPYSRRLLDVQAPVEDFLRAFGFATVPWPPVEEGCATPAPSQPARV